MSQLQRFIRRLANVLRGSRADDRLSRELDAHLRLIQDDFERRGMSPDDARRAARRAFGGVEQAKEQQRDARSFVWLEDARRDLAYALRTLRPVPEWTHVMAITRVAVPMHQQRRLGGVMIVVRRQHFIGRAVADVTPSTTSVHLRRLEKQRLVKQVAQGTHRYFSLEGAHVAAALEALSVSADGSGPVFVPNTPGRLRAARTCYDHIAGTLGVLLHDRLRQLRWLVSATDRAYDLTPEGVAGLQKLGVDVGSTRALRRCFAAPCLDWSERRYHLAGALAAALLSMTLKRKWIVRDLDSRILTVTPLGRRELKRCIGIEAPGK